MKSSKIARNLGLTKGYTDAYYSIEFDNSDLHDLLNDECVQFQELAGQDTWSFEDGSYIARSGGDYFIGDDIEKLEAST